MIHDMVTGCLESFFSVVKNRLLSIEKYFNQYVVSANTI